MKALAVTLTIAYLGFVVWLICDHVTFWRQFGYYRRKR